MTNQATVRIEPPIDTTISCVLIPLIIAIILLGEIGISIQLQLLSIMVKIAHNNEGLRLPI